MGLMKVNPLSSDLLEVLSVVWKIPVSSKVAVFCWRCFLNRLPTKDNLIRRNATINNMRCGLREGFDETLHHIFFHCHFAKAIWKDVLRWVELKKQ